MPKVSKKRASLKIKKSTKVKVQVQNLTLVTQFRVRNIPQTEYMWTLMEPYVTNWYKLITSDIVRDFGEGKVVRSMIAHHPSSWHLVFTMVYKKKDGGALSELISILQEGDLDADGNYPLQLYSSLSAAIPSGSYSVYDTVVNSWCDMKMKTKH